MLTIKYGEGGFPVYPGMAGRTGNRNDPIWNSFQQIDSFHKCGIHNIGLLLDDMKWLNSINPSNSINNISDCFDQRHVIIHDYTSLFFLMHSMM